MSRPEETSCGPHAAQSGEQSQPLRLHHQACASTARPQWQGDYAGKRKIAGNRRQLSDTIIVTLYGKKRPVGKK